MLYWQGWKDDTVKKLTLTVLVCLLLAIGFSGQAEYLGSVPEDGIFVVQSEKHTCTLIATTMMLRNYAYQRDSIYEMVTESAVRDCGWNNRGLLWDFTIGSVQVHCDHGISGSRDKKTYLIEALKEHPEGIVIYDANMPHAVWLFGYDEDADIFYCGDTTTAVAGRQIELSECILRGKTQEEKISRIDRIWFVANPVEIA